MQKNSSYIILLHTKPYDSHMYVKHTGTPGFSLSAIHKHTKRLISNFYQPFLKTFLNINVMTKNLFNVRFRDVFNRAEAE